jgi:hypothetical protein
LLDEWGGFSLLDPLSKNSQCQRLNPRHGFCARKSVSHHARNLRDLRDPTPIFLFLSFDCEPHDWRRISDQRRKLKSIRRPLLFTDCVALLFTNHKST